MIAARYRIKTFRLIVLLRESLAGPTKAPPSVPITPELIYAVKGGIVTEEGKQGCELPNSKRSKTQAALFAAAKCSNTNNSAKTSAKNYSRREFMDCILTSKAIYHRLFFRSSIQFSRLPVFTLTVKELDRRQSSG